MEIKEYIIGIAIFILTLFVVIYGINAFYSDPNYDDFCGNQRAIAPSVQTNTSESCIEAGGKWNTYDQVRPPLKSGSDGYCDLDYYCRQDYQDAQEKHDMVVFIFSIPLGVLIILTGLFIFKLDLVGFGLMTGGTATIIYGAGTYWQYGEDWFKFTISLLGLIALIFIAYWFDKRFVKSSGRKDKK